jgi:serine/threonine kinase 16
MASCFDVLWSMLSPQTYTIEGRTYSVLSRLGEGGFAVVELVESTRDGRRYALKRILLQSQEARMLGELELSMLRKLDHPGIVPLIGSARISSTTAGQPDQLLLLLDYYPRGSLQDHINLVAAGGAATSRSSTLWITRVLVNICEAVQQIHMSDPPMIHRDLKPDNIMLGLDAQIAIIDFGSCVVAKRQITDRIGLQQLIDESERYCTPTYRAPELWDRGRDDIVELDERVDVWSLGCVLYAMMFGVNPFELVEQNGGNLKLAIIESNFQFPTGHTYPSSLTDLVTDMLNKDETARLTIEQVLERARKMGAQQ